MAEQDPKQNETESPQVENGSPESKVDGAEEVVAAEAAGSAETADEPSLEEEVTHLQEDLAAARDAALRAQADAQNVKRRAEQDVEKARKFALERFAGELLPVVDNLERALESATGDDEAIKPIAEGVELTLKSFLDVLGKQNIEVVDPDGEPFDPNLHQAMSMVENNEVEPNTVIAVMQKGYTLNGRLIRPAMVMVSKSS
ncbi:nucleotide exchange factor GrpE [Seongchinamella unica]|uniref:Protein GrpE n=1 Tax=Seongchinamella unica TaxID=2547392 RepID=A0A4R5LUS1_9GAMM|nr:nucleotide exchange factor GrpE [Seongchinamella unica]TDG15176.1 nucleotide exchange factor GrpE [Seongchinamella unica]